MYTVSRNPPALSGSRRPGGSDGEAAVSTASVHGRAREDAEWIAVSLKVRGSAGPRHALTASPAVRRCSRTWRGLPRFAVTRGVGVNDGSVIDARDDEPGWWGTFGERVIYEDPGLWLEQVDVELPSRERVWQHVVRLPRAVAVLLLNGQGQVLFTRRHRFIQDRWGWELPGGAVDEDEDPRDAAVRELEDQTGYRAGVLEHLMTFQPVPEVLDAERVVFLGRDAQRVGEPVRPEGVEQEWLPLASVVGLIAARGIWDAASVVGLLSYLATIR
jgi:8-oxo-dGDP phosphatase